MTEEGFGKKVVRLLNNSADTIVFAALGVFIAVIALIVWRKAGNTPLTSFPQDWGQVGDFFGGMLNPMIAFAALYMLSQAVSLQKRELTAAQRVLEKQARSAEETTQLAALTSLVDSALAEVQIHRDYLNFLVQQISSQDQAFNASENALHIHARGRKGPDDIYPLYAYDGTVITRTLAVKMISDLNLAIQARMANRVEFEVEIQSILKEGRARAHADRT